MISICRVKKQTKTKQTPPLPKQNNKPPPSKPVCFRSEWLLIGFDQTFCFNVCSVSSVTADNRNTRRTDKCPDGRQPQANVRDNVPVEEASPVEVASRSVLSACQAAWDGVRWCRTKSGTLSPVDNANTSSIRERRLWKMASLKRSKQDEGEDGEILTQQQLLTQTPTHR